MTKKHQPLKISFLYSRIYIILTGGVMATRLEKKKARRKNRIEGKERRKIQVSRPTSQIPFPKSHTSNPRAEHIPLFEDDGSDIEDPFQERVEKSLPVLRRIRYNPFGTEDSDEEKRIFKYIDEHFEPFCWTAEGGGVDAFKYQREHVAWQLKNVKMTFEESTILTEKATGKKMSREERKFAKQVFDRGGPRQYIEEGLEYMIQAQCACAELLRHKICIEEQRVYLRALHQKGEGWLKTLFISFRKDTELLKELDFDGGNEERIIATKMSWVKAWDSAIARRTPTFEEWHTWYELIHANLDDDRTYQNIKLYLWELAQLSYELPTDPVQKFLGGTIYHMIARKEGAKPVEKHLASALGTIAEEQNIFSAPHYTLIREGKKAGHFILDTNVRLIFKPATMEDAKLLDTVHSVVQEPSAMYWRLAAIDPRCRPGAQKEELKDVVEELKRNPKAMKLCELDCVRPAGVRIETSKGMHIALLNAGKTLAEKVKEATTIDEKHRLYEGALNQLRKLHFVATENVIRVRQQHYLTPSAHLYDDYPVLPEFSLEKVIHRRVGERLGITEKFRKLFMDVAQIQDFHQKSFYGVLHLDDDETNFAEQGLIDITPRWGPIAFDVARLLYGGSRQLKKGLDIKRLRDYYVDTLLEFGKKTNQLSTALPWEKVQEENKQWYSREQFMAYMMNHYVPITQMMQKEKGMILMPEDIVEALASRTSSSATVDWDYSRRESRQDLEEQIQTAGIIVTMGEVGSYTKQMTQFPKESQEWKYAREERALAVQASLTLMKYQGFQELHTNWRFYLEESGKISEEEIKYVPHEFKGILIPDLKEKVRQTVCRLDMQTFDALDDIDAPLDEVFKKIASFVASRAF